MSTTAQRYCGTPAVHDDAVRIACEGAALFVEEYLARIKREEWPSHLFDVMFMCKDRDGWFWAFTQDQHDTLRANTQNKLGAESFHAALNYFRLSTAGFINLLERTENLVVRVADFQKEDLICVNVGYRIERRSQYAKSFETIENAIPDLTQCSFHYFRVSSHSTSGGKKVLADGALVAVFKLDRTLDSQPGARLDKVTAIRAWIEKWRNQNETFGRVKDIVADVARPFQRASAVAAILARNFSHHIGSHVIPRTTVDAIQGRLSELYGESGCGLDEGEVLQSVSRLKTSLDEYIQKKADFLAEVTTDPNSSSDSKLLGRDIVVPMMRNALLMDSIAKNEGFDYRLNSERELNEDDAGLIEGLPTTYREVAWRQRRMTSHLQLSLCVRDAQGCKRLLGPAMPPFDPYYGLQGLEETAPQPAPFGVVPEAANLDPVVSVPGVVGQFALYGVLENIIRNAAKHVPRDHKDDVLHIHMLVEDTSDDYYQLSIWDNRTNPGSIETTAVIPGGDAKGKQVTQKLAEYLDGWAKADLIDANGAVRRDAWGVAEIAICANLLAGRSNFEPGSEVLTIKEGPSPDITHDPLDCRGDHETHEGCAATRLIYQLRLLKAKRCVLVGRAFIDAWDQDGMLEGLARQGVHVFGTVNELRAFLVRSEARNAFQFAVFDGDSTKPAELCESEGGAVLAFTAALPFRILWLSEAGASIDWQAKPMATVTASRREFLEILASVRHPSELAAKIMERLWQLWIGDNPCLNPSRLSVVPVVHLGVPGTDRLYVSWAEATRAFNTRLNPGPVTMCVQGTGGAHEGEVPSYGVAARVAFVRHGDQGLGELGSDDAYVAFHKRSADCDLLLGATLPTSAQPFWELPYALAEAGLVRILVVDERMAERAMMPYSGDTTVGLRLIRATNRTPCFWHLAQRAKIYVATHLQVGDEPSSMQPLHERSFTSAEERFRSQAGSTCPSLKVQVSDKGLVVRAYDEIGDAPLDHDVPLKFDVVVIHQGVIDTFRPRTAKGEPAIDEKTLRAWIVKSHPWLVVESGRGIPPGLQRQPIRFLSFSVLDKAMMRDGIGKLLLTRRLMALPRFVDNGDLP